MSPARRNFGHTWWGQAWVEALETRARLDPNRLPRGRTYARKEHVASLQLAPGVVWANVAGSRPTPYSVRIGVRTFTDDQWMLVLAAVVAKAGHAAALLDGELDPGVVEDARSAGVDLLPGPGDLQLRCSCPDWAVPCKHAAAVCYLVADELDADPFKLLELRGMARDEVLAEVRSLRSGGGVEAPAAASAVEEDEGVRASEAWARVPGALPSVPHPPTAPGHPAPWPADPPRGLPFSVASVLAVADAVAWAWAQTRGEAPSWLALDAPTDLARRAATAPSVVAAGGDGRALVASAAAWRAAGPEGVAVLDEPPWRPPVAAMAAAREAVLAAGVPSRSVRVDANRITAGPGVQLRHSRDGRWWRFEKRHGRWELGASPALEVDELVATD